MSFKPLLPALCLLAVCLFMSPAIAVKAAENEEQSIAGPPLPRSIYDRPYSLWESQIDGPMLKRNTALLFGAGIGAMGVLYLMPSSVTHWENDDKSPFEKWWHNVSRPPVWDEDDWFLNYVTHPYSGAIYYMGARSAGAGAGQSFVYSFAISTFFWEYGIESFAERPSIQDLIVTPVAGAILGEGFFLTKRHIVANDYRLFGSRALGVTTALLIDPISEIGDFFFGETGGTRNLMLHGQPLLSKDGKLGFAVSFSLSF